MLVGRSSPWAVTNVNGVGYEVGVPVQTLYRLPVTGGAVQLYTQFVVREDAHLLFDSATADERATFRQLVKVSGIGAKTALDVLSAVSTDELAQAITEENVKCLSSTSGVGKKTAEHMVSELRDKPVSAVSDGLTTLPIAADGTDDIVSTLLALGYSEREAEVIAKGLPRGTDVGEGVWLMLKNLPK